MEVPDHEDLANHVVPESCAVCREARGEALTGVRVGQPLSHDRTSSRVPTYLCIRKAIPWSAILRVLRRPGVVLDPGMHVRSLSGNREISRLASRITGLVRVGKARSRSR